MDPRIERIRAGMSAEGLDAVVLTNPHDVLYATGYSSTFEGWALQEPVSAAVVTADGRVVLCLPEALIALLPVMQEQGDPDRADELRVFELLNFCELSREVDPDAGTSAIADAALAMYGERVKGSSEPHAIAALAATLRDHGLVDARIGVDDLRTGFTLRDHFGLGGLDVRDALNLMIRARVVKTEPELAAFRRIGKLADRIMTYAGERLEPGITWDEFTCDVAQYMVGLDVSPVDEDAMLFGGAFSGEFIPELFRTRHAGALKAGQIVIIETLGSAEKFWMDINRTATIGPPTRQFQQQHDMVRDTFLHMIELMKPGANTADVQRAGFEYLRERGAPAPQKLIAVAHGIGHMPVEMPQPYPHMGVAGSRGFVLEEGMVISLDCLYFGAKLGPCHMENVFIIGRDGAESTYDTPLELLGPR